MRQSTAGVLFFFLFPSLSACQCISHKTFLTRHDFFVAVRLVATKNNWVLLHLPVEICRCICRDDFSFFPFRTRWSCWHWIGFQCVHAFVCLEKKNKQTNHTPNANLLRQRIASQDGRLQQQDVRHDTSQSSSGSLCFSCFVFFFSLHNQGGL